MNNDDAVCLCFHVSKRKIVSYLKREQPEKVSQISECLSAGTGCGWCIPFLEKLHAQATAGVAEPDLPVSPEEYARQRAVYRAAGKKNKPR